MALIYTHKMKVRYYECDTQGIVNHANYLHYFETARLEMLVQCGGNIDNVAALNTGPIVRKAEIDYLNSLHNADEFICSIEIERKGIRYFFNQKIIRTADNAQCATAKIEIVWLTNGKVMKPDEMDKLFADYSTWI